MEELLSMNLLKLILFIALFTMCCGEKLESVNPEMKILKSFYPVSKERCKISINRATGDLKEPQPLILSSSRKILKPDETGVLNIPIGQSILLACEGKSNSFFNTSLKSQQIIEASCVQQKEFSVNGTIYSFKSFACKRSMRATTKIVGSCLNTFSKVELGFEISDNFIPVIEICRDNKTDETFYAKSELNKSINGQQRGSRPPWITEAFFHDKKINYYYTKHHQQMILSKILNSTELAKEYLKKNMLTRGHLAAKADFVYTFEQDMTFSYANAAPQWSTFNSRNWNKIETAIKEFVTRNDLKVTIYTGVHGQMKLRDSNNEKKSIYLNFNKDNVGYIKVPQFYWKIIYEPVRRLAFAIVGVNDPFSKEITDDMFLCEDISDNQLFNWLKKSLKDRKNIEYGYSYICQYEDLKKVVTTVPDLEVNGILRI